MKRALAAAFLLAAMVAGAYWLGFFGAPDRTEVASSSAAVRNAALPANDRATTSRSALPAGALDIRLRGVFIGREKNEAGYAIVNLGAADKAVRVGDMLRADAVLAEIHPTHIVVNHAGSFRRVELDKAARPGAPPPDPPRAVAAANSAPAIDIEQLASNSTGGVIILAVTPGSELESLGLQRGDVVLGLNGQAVSNPAELKERYAKLARGEPVQVEVVQRNRRVLLERHVLIH